MRKKLSLLFIVTGLLFLFWAIFGRYVVLPGYIESFADNGGGSGTLPDDVEAWKIARYLVWAFSFKLGVYLIALGALLKTKITRKRFSAFAAGGLFYISVAYLPLSGQPWMFGAAGVLMTILMVIIILSSTSLRDKVAKTSVTANDLRLAGYFFFAMGTYTLCGLLGVRTSALDPHKMIEYGLEADAMSFALHALIEFALGWIFIAASYKKIKND